jgi:YbgC/YbaW family acyl-CoA thioester hydrolase
MMKRAEVAHRHPVRVYWEDTDAAGIVFYANYLKFFERARTEWLRSRGFEQEQLRSSAGIAFVVTDTSLRCIVPARLDDLLDVTVIVERPGGPVACSPRGRSASAASSLELSSRAVSPTTSVFPSAETAPPR